jgi:hypothetical protein
MGMRIDRLGEREAVAAVLDSWRGGWVITPNLEHPRQFRGRPELRPLFHRLAQEPRRLFRRYVVHGLPFAVRALWHALRTRARR